MRGQSPRHRGAYARSVTAKSISRLVAAGAAKRKAFERGRAAVRTHDIVVGDLDAGEIAGTRSRIEVEGGEAIGMCRVAHGRPRRFLFYVNRRALAGRRVGCADGGDDPACRRVEEQLV